MPPGQPRWPGDPSEFPVRCFTISTNTEQISGGTVANVADALVAAGDPCPHRCQKWDNHRQSSLRSVRTWFRQSMRVAPGFPYCQNLLDKDLLDVEWDREDFRFERRGFLRSGLVRRGLVRRGEGFPAIQAPERSPLPLSEVVCVKKIEKRKALAKSDTPLSEEKRRKTNDTGVLKVCVFQQTYNHRHMTSYNMTRGPL